jgi:hypothetical protein
VFVGELINGHSIDQPVQSTCHRGAFARRVIRGTTERVRQEELRALRLRNHTVELRDLLAHDLSPLWTGSVEDRRRRLERDAELMKDLDEGQPAELVGAIHSGAAAPSLWSDQSAVVVVAKRRRGHLQPGSGLADRDGVHAAI